MRGWLIVAGLWVALGAAAPAGAQDGATGETLEQLEGLEEEAAGGSGVPAVEPLTETEAAKVDPEGVAPLGDPLTCLARTVYWEAKGEDVAAMEGVANVVMNRLAAEPFPDTICGVVTEGKDGGPCQFAWWCDGSSDDVEEPDRYAITTEVARRALNQELADRTDGALFFHGINDTPGWGDDYVRTVKLGDHVFYRLPNEDGG